MTSSHLFEADRCPRAVANLTMSGKFHALGRARRALHIAAACVKTSVCRQIEVLKSVPTGAIMTKS